MSHFDDSWFWPVLEQYRDDEGHTLGEAEQAWLQASTLPREVIDKAVSTQQWRSSPKSARGVGFVIDLIESRFDRNDSFTYLEFGVCFGTTIASVLQHFHNARGIGLEINPARRHVAKWVCDHVADRFALSGRVNIMSHSVLDAPLAPDCIDVVMMDTDHRYPDDLNYVEHVLRCGALREGFLFIGDDPMHTGTQRAREQFTSEHSSTYSVEVSERQNLWWFCDRAKSPIAAGS